MRVERPALRHELRIAMTARRDRLMMPQQTMRGTSGGYSTFVFQICLPVLASIAIVALLVVA